MDINDWRGISTVFLTVAFISTWVWLWSSKRKTGFDEAANLPFVEDELLSDVDNKHSRDGE